MVKKGEALARGSVEWRLPPARHPQCAE